MLNRLNFILKSKNRHGVHSPFVYSLNDKCFNNRSHYKEYDNLTKQFPDVSFFVKNKRLRLFFRLLQFLNLRNYAIICQEEHFFSWKNTQKYDLIFIANKNSISLEDIIKTMHNHSLLIVQNIYKENKTLWQKIQKCPDIHVTIDTYQQGLAFLRKEQQKEHFIIRI